MSVVSIVTAVQVVIVTAVTMTEFMIVGSRQKLDAVADNHCINLNIEEKIIKRVDQ